MRDHRDGIQSDGRVGTAVNEMCDTGESTGEGATERKSKYVGGTGGGRERNREAGEGRGGGREARVIYLFIYFCSRVYLCQLAG